MRVLLFRSLCDTGGVSSSMLLLGRELTKRGAAVEYWFCTGSHRFAEFEATGAATLGNMADLARRLDRGDIDVVHMTATDPGAQIVGKLAGASRVVVTARGAISDIWDHTNCLAHTAISHGMAALNQPYTDVHMDVVRNSIDAGRYGPPGERTAGPPIIAFVGRTTSHEKDFPRFTRIAKRLVDKGARVWVADPHGSGWDRFTGPTASRFEIERWERIPHAEMPDFYRAVAASGGALVIPSMSEGFGNVAPEAAACGARVAANDVIGLREAVVDGVTGRLFSPNAPDAEVAALLEDWMAERYDAHALSGTTKRLFSPAVMVDAYLSVYSRETPRRWLREDPPLADTSELKHLMNHLREQGRWRAQFNRAAALDLAAAGDRHHALEALELSVRSAPLELLRPSVARAIARVGRRLVFGDGLFR
jgi:hypothetical protein